MPKGDKAFYSSDRAGGYGKDDLYWFNLPETLRPQSVTYMKGRIFDAKIILRLAFFMWWI